MKFQTELNDFKIFIFSSVLYQRKVRFLVVGHNNNENNDITELAIYKCERERYRVGFTFSVVTVRRQLFRIDCVTRQRCWISWITLLFIFRRRRTVSPCPSPPSPSGNKRSKIVVLGKVLLHLSFLAGASGWYSGDKWTWIAFQAIGGRVRNTILLYYYMVLFGWYGRTTLAIYSKPYTICRTPRSRL